MTVAEIKNTVRLYEAEANQHRRGGAEYWTARFLEVPHCLAEGTTEKEARANLEAMIAPFLGNIYDDASELPEPISRAKSRMRFRVVSNPPAAGSMSMVTVVKAAETETRGSRASTPHFGKPVPA